MNTEKDYYAMLGVLPDAEDIVIKAAYKALAQRYHPDRFGGSQAAAHAHMSELNEAYAVLSDQEKRKCYDQLRGARTQSGSSAFADVEENAPPGEDPLAKDWRIAVKYYPDLAALEQRLSGFSWKLANTYRAYLLETRQFDTRASVAGLMEAHFLGTYFGDNERYLDFARKLIVAKQRKAALALNDAIRVLGSNADPRRVIPKIARDFRVMHLAIDKERMCSLLSETRASTEHTRLFMQMLSELGGSFASAGDPRRPERTSADKGCTVEFEGRDFTFPSEYEFRTWFRRNVLPLAEQLVQ